MVIHALTEKGRGYRPAELDPGKMHAMKPVTASAPKGPKAPSYSAVVGKTLVELAKADPRIVGITAAMPEGTGLAALADAAPTSFSTSASRSSMRSRSRQGWPAGA